MDPEEGDLLFETMKTLAVIGPIRHALGETDDYRGNGPCSVLVEPVAVLLCRFGHPPLP